MTDARGVGERRLPTGFSARHRRTGHAGVGTMPASWAGGC